MTVKIKDSVPVLLLFLLAVMPLIIGLGYAILYSFGIIGSLNNGFTFSNWKHLFDSNEVLISFLYSGILSFVSITICILIALAAALKFNSFFIKGILSYIIYFPLAFPSVVAAFFFFEVLSGAGLLSRIFYQAGLIQSNDQFPGLINDKWGIGIIITQIFLSCPIFILLYTTLIRSERLNEFRDLASSLGASSGQFTFRIAIPVLLRKSLPTIFLYFIFKLGAYEIPLLLGRSRPQTISVLTISKLQRFNLLDIPMGYAIAILYSIVVLVLLIIALKITRENVI